MSPTFLVDFYGRDFAITPDVLIPRPETEMMIDAVLNLAGKAYLPGIKPARAKLPKEFRLLDVGTGSGCIAITLKLELPETQASACDISEKALNVARENARNFDAKINFTKSDLMENISGNFDVVVANLPYVDEDWEWVDKKALSREPEIALYARDGGLELIKKLIKQLKGRTKYLILEADPCQHERIIAFAEKNSFSLFEIRGYALVFSYLL